MDHLALGDAGTHGPLEDAAEALGAPALADPGQAGVIGQRLAQAIAAEPADREVDLHLPQEATIVDDPEQEPGQHQPHSDLRIDARPATSGVVKVSDFDVQPTQIEDAVHPDQQWSSGSRSRNDPATNRSGCLRSFRLNIVRLTGPDTPHLGASHESSGFSTAPEALDAQPSGHATLKLPTAVAAMIQTISPTVIRSPEGGPDRWAYSLASPAVGFGGLSREDASMTFLRSHLIHEMA